MRSKHTDIQKSGSYVRLDTYSQQYALSLLQTGMVNGLADESAVIHIQRGIMLLLKEIIIKYNRGSTTSIKTETAERLLGSLLYSIDARLAVCSCPEDALELLKAGNIRQIYSEGLDIVKGLLEDSRVLHRQLATQKLNVALYAYNSTIDEAIPGVLETYDPIYFAQDTGATIDYPLLFDDRETCGIFFINQYLGKLTIENIFCSLYDPVSINRLLYNYGKVYRIDYRDLLINIMEVILINSLGSVLSGNNASNLHIAPYQYTILTDKFSHLDHEICSSLIKQAIATILNEMGIEDLKFKDYIRNFQMKILPRFLNALANHNLPNLIIPDNADTPSPGITWNEGQKLNDDEFRIFVKQILNCPEGTSKAAAIKADIHSLADFIDVLEADCLFNNEYEDLFEVLGDLELSILAKVVFAEELRTAPNMNFRQITEINRDSPLWQIEFASFLSRLDSARIKAIEQYIHYL